MTEAYLSYKLIKWAQMSLWLRWAENKLTSSRKIFLKMNCKWIKWCLELMDMQEKESIMSVLVWIEKSVIQDHCLASQGFCVMPNSDPKWQIFLSTPKSHERFLYSFIWDRNCHVTTRAKKCNLTQGCVRLLMWHFDVTWWHFHVSFDVILYQFDISFSKMWGHQCRQKEPIINV